MCEGSCRANACGRHARSFTNVLPLLAALIPKKTSHHCAFWESRHQVCFPPQPVISATSAKVVLKSVVFKRTVPVKSLWTAGPAKNFHSRAVTAEKKEHKGSIIKGRIAEILSQVQLPVNSWQRLYLWKKRKLRLVLSLSVTVRLVPCQL
ncbi:hypothetical protein MTO96_019303 [Rhipicephalus appendiculatus]